MSASQFDPRRPPALQGVHTILKPISQTEILPLLLAYAGDPDLMELRCGLGDKPTQALIQRHVAAGDICLWNVASRHPDPNKPQAQPAAWAVYSRVSTLHYIGVFTPLQGELRGAPLDEAVHAEVLECLCEALFSGTEADQVVSHVAIPCSEELYALYMRLGWEQWSTEWLFRAPPRFIFALPRSIYALYHEDPQDE
jgi:hypothetical protein